MPEEPKQALEPLLEREKLTGEDYALLLRQTGLGKPAVDALRAAGREDAVLRIQDTFYAPVNYVCRRFNPICFEEHLVDDAGARSAAVELAPLENGDILISPGSHTMGWRNGHAAIVVDAEQGTTLESVVLGQDACVQSISKWQGYPAFLVLRLKGVPAETRAAIAADALTRLEGVPYRLLVGILSPRSSESGPPAGTQCAHLVWEAYRPFGYDLDSGGGLVLTPRDIANSPLLELVQAYGMDPEKLWH